MIRITAAHIHGTGELVSTSFELLSLSLQCRFVLLSLENRQVLRGRLVPDRRWRRKGRSAVRKWPACGQLEDVKHWNGVPCWIQTMYLCPTGFAQPIGYRAVLLRLSQLFLRRIGEVQIQEVERKQREREIKREKHYWPFYQ
jgi:hypothetical protein